MSIAYKGTVFSFVGEKFRKPLEELPNLDPSVYTIQPGSRPMKSDDPVDDSNIDSRVKKCVEESLKEVGDINVDHL